MPRIPDFVLDCAIYLYPSVQAAEEREQAGGSGFLLGVTSDRIKQKGYWRYAVSNSHVVRTSSVIRLNTKSGETDVIEVPAEAWIHHPDGDDIAVCSLGLSNDLHKYEVIGDKMLLTKAEIDEHAIGPGDDCFLVGRFVAHEGRERNLPAVLFGSIAMMPHEPIENPKRGPKQESFLVEMRSLGGYSGSPVFLGLPGYSKVRLYPKDAPAPPEERSFGPWLLGVNWGHLSYRNPLRREDGSKDPSNKHVEANTGMMTVVPAWKLRELLDCDELAVPRRQEEDRIVGEEASRGAEGEPEEPQKPVAP